LRAEFNGIARLEAQYRRSNGLSLSERRDLDRRFDLLRTNPRFGALLARIGLGERH